MNKLYGNKRKVLKVIVKNYRKNNPITRFDIPKLCKISKNEINLILDSLYSDKYFSYSGMNYSVILTDKGLSYFHSETCDNIEICIKSLVFPVVVSFFTTLITLWLRGSL